MHFWDHSVVPPLHVHLQHPQPRFDSMAATVVPSSSPSAAVTLSPSLAERPTVPGGLGLPATTPGPGVVVVGGGGGDLTAATQPPPPLRSPPVNVTSPTGGVGRPQNNQVSQVTLYGVPIVCLWIDGRERLCLAQISNTLLKDYSYNEIHNRRVALGITCVQCTPVQLEILRRAGAMPVSSRRCGMITKREAERLVKSFLEDMTPPKLPDDFAFDVSHGCGWGCRGSFLPARYNSSRAKCVKCYYCNMFFSPNKFIFHFHRMPESKYNHPDAANFNSWRRHLCLTGGPSCTDDLIHAWEDVKAMFNGGSRKRVMAASVQSFTKSQDQSHAKRVKAQHAESQSRAESSMALTSKLQHAFHQRFPHAATAGGPNYPFPLFPHANKPMPPVAAKAFPMFATAQHLHMSATSPTRGEGRPQAGSAILPTATARQMPPFPQHIAQETIYPSYEMIWAKHLGLSMYNENGFPPPHPRCLLDTSTSTKRDERVSPPGGGDTEANKTGSGESGSRVRDGASSKGLIHGQFSAFKPVAAVTNNNLFKPYELDDDRGDRVRDLCHHNDCELLSDSCGDDESEPDNIDVDTVEEEERKNVSKEHEQCRQHCRDSSPDIATLSRDKTVGENVTAGGREASCSSPTAEFGVLCDSNDNCIEKGDSLSYTRPELSVVRSCGTGGGDLDQLAAAAGAKTEAVSQDQLENELMTAIETRKKLEEEFNIIKSTFEQRVHHECECREEMVRRFQEVRRRLSQELDQEQRARSSLQHHHPHRSGGSTENQNAMATPHFNKMLDTGPSLLQ